jgi:hypothetical protein
VRNWTSLHPISEGGVFREHGVTGDIKEVIPRADDEAVFIVTAGDSFATTDSELWPYRLADRKGISFLDSLFDSLLRAVSDTSGRSVAQTCQTGEYDVARPGTS